MKQEHYFSEQQESQEKLIKLSCKLLGNSLEFNTISGVFSKKKIDLGTKVLIDNIKISTNDTVLDFGCGIGVVGIAIKKDFPTTNVFLTDINTRAVKIANMNCKLNNTSCTILQGNMYEAIPKKIKFNAIISNLPQHAGRKVCFNIIEQSKQFLKPKGTLQVVARHQKGGKMIERKMNELFQNIEVLGKQSGYRVYSSTHNQ
jgi:16S rRNA (guanine1207-N2)-methyltransferase